MIIKKIGYYSRFEELKQQVLELVNTVMESNHISLQYDSLTRDTSWLNAYGEDKTRRERFFDQLQPQLKDTEIDRLFASLGFSMSRTRIFALDPNTVGYTVHRDTTARIHIPIVTAELARFYSYEPEEQCCDFMPADGSIYYVDTTKHHTFKNLSPITRIHIVGCYYGTDIWN